LFINRILDGLKHIHKPQLKFLTVLFTTIFVCQSRINFSSLARNCHLNEKTFRRNFRKEFDFTRLNEAIIGQSKCQIGAFAMDASFIKKSGQETFGLDKFWNGCAGKAEKGLEASIISLVDIKENVSFALTVDQTEPNLANRETVPEKKTRTDFYAEQLEKNAETILKYTRIGVFDGFYAKQKFVTRTVTAGFTMISRLRQDANLKYLYTGAQKPTGRHRKYAGKVDFNDLSKCRESVVKIDNKEIHIYSAIIWSVSLARKIKLVVVRFKRKSVNFGREMANPNQGESERKPFSMKSIKQQFFNEHLLKLFISKSGLEQSLIKYQETLEDLKNYAAIYS